MLESARPRLLGLTRNVHHSDGVLLPFRTKAEQLATGVELEVSDCRGQVQYLFQGLGAQSVGSSGEDVWGEAGAGPGSTPQLTSPKTSPTGVLRTPPQEPVPGTRHWRPGQLRPGSISLPVKSFDF